MLLTVSTSLSSVGNTSNNHPKALPVPGKAGWLLTVIDRQTCQHHGSCRCAGISLGPARREESLSAL